MSCHTSAQHLAEPTDELAQSNSGNFSNGSQSGLSARSRCQVRISFRVALAVLIVSLSVVAAVIAFVPTYVSAMSSVTSITTTLRNEVGEKIQAGVLGFFTAPQAYISSLMLSARLGAMSANDTNSLIMWYGSVSEASGLPTYSGFDNKLTILSLGTPITGRPFEHSVSIYNNATTLFSYTYNVSSRTLVGTSNSSTTFDPTLRPWYEPLKQRQSWSNVYLDTFGTYSVITAGGPFIDVAGKTIGAIGIDFPTTAVVEYLRVQQVGKSGRVLLADYETRGYLGGNMNVLGVVNKSDGTLRMAYLSDVAAQDGLFGRAFAAVGEEWLLNCSTPCHVEIKGREPVDSVLVDVLAVSDQHGLNQRLIIVLPASDFLASFDRDYKVSAGATAAAILAVLIIGLILGHRLLQPLLRLEEKLYATASFEVGAQEMEWSLLTEVYRIEVAFDTMRKELKRVRSFLPQSILRQLDEESSEDVTEDIRNGAISEAKDEATNGIITHQHRQGWENPRSDGNGSPVTSSSAITHEELVSTFEHGPLDEEQLTSGEQRAQASLLPRDPPAPVTNANPLEPNRGGNSDGAELMGVGPSHQLPAAMRQEGRPKSGETSPHRHDTQESGAVVTIVVPKDHRSSKSSRAPLTLEMPLRGRRVTVVMGNLLSFHKAVTITSADELHAMHAKVCSTILHQTNTAGGVVDLFFGDRFVVSFNASKQCPPHGTRAAAMMMGTTETLGAEMSQVKGYAGIRFGAATGNVLCGTFGSITMKRFNIVGSVINHAYALMQQTKVERVTNLISQSSFELMSAEFFVQHVNYLMLPQTQGGSLVSTVVSRLRQRHRLGSLSSTSSDEDSYPVSASNDDTTTRVREIVQDRVEEAKLMALGEQINVAFETFARGEIDKAKLMADKIPPPHNAGLMKSIRTALELRSKAERDAF